MDGSELFVFGFEKTGKFGGYLENYYMIGRNEVESRLGSLAKHKKEWKWMGVNYLFLVLKKLRSWSENYWMEMVRSLQIRQGFLY